MPCRAVPCRAAKINYKLRRAFRSGMQKCRGGRRRREKKRERKRERERKRDGEKRKEKGPARPGELLASARVHTRFPLSPALGISFRRVYDAEDGLGVATPACPLLSLTTSKGSALLGLR